MKLITTIFVLLIVFSSCKKDPPVDLCKNGFLDPGETGVDCGGTCAPCVASYQPNAYMIVNGIGVTFSNYSLSFANNLWFLNFNNDSIQIQMNIGTSISVGNYAIVPTYSFAFYKGISYPLLTTSNSVIGISQNVISDQRLTALFQAKFYRSGFVDTLKLTGGDLYQIPY